MAYLKNLDHLFEEKSFGKRILDKISNKLTESEDKTWFKYSIKPLGYFPTLSAIYYTLFGAKKDLEKYGAKKVVFKETLHIAYAVLGKIVIGGYATMVISTGIWDPREFWEKKLEPIIKPEKEINKEETYNNSSNSSLEI